MNAGVNHVEVRHTARHTCHPSLVGRRRHHLLLHHGLSQRLPNWWFALHHLVTRRHGSECLLRVVSRCSSRLLWPSIDRHGLCGRGSRCLRWNEGLKVGRLFRFLLEAWRLSLNESGLLLGLHVSRRPALSGRCPEHERCWYIELGRCGKSRARRTCLGWQRWLLDGLRDRCWFQRLAHCLLLCGKRLGFSVGKQC